MSEMEANMMPPQPPHMPPMVAPTFMQRLCDLLHKPVNVMLNCAGATTPVAGTLHAVGQDYLELVTGAGANARVTIVPLWNVCAVMAAGAMDDICPPPQPPHYPECPMPGPGGNCPPPMAPPPGMMGPGGGMMGPGMNGGIPGFMDVKEEKK